MKWFRTGQLAKLNGVTSQTIRRWIKQGRYENVQTTPNGQSRIGINSDAVAIGYTRVSSRKQKSSLTTQAEIILDKYPGIEIVSDIGSGFNFKRRKFRALLERCLRGDAIEIVVANRDRFTRVGTEIVDIIIQSGGGRVVSLDPDDKEQDKFDTSILIGFITSFCNSHYGRRSSRRKNRQPKDTNPPGG